MTGCGPNWSNESKNEGRDRTGGLLLAPWVNSRTPLIHSCWLNQNISCVLAQSLTLLLLQSLEFGG